MRDNLSIALNQVRPCRFRAVYRIGQTRIVTSYKLIVRETVEEKILKLQEASER